MSYSYKKNSCYWYFNIYMYDIDIKTWQKSKAKVMHIKTKLTYVVIVKWLGIFKLESLKLGVNKSVLTQCTHPKSQQ